MGWFFWLDSSDVDFDSEADFTVRTTAVNDVPHSLAFGNIVSSHHTMSAQMVSVASSVMKDKHEDLLSPAECGAIAEREAKTRKVEWRPAERGPKLIAVRDDEDRRVPMNQVEQEGMYARLRRQVGLDSAPSGTQVLIRDEIDEFDETRPSSLDEVALARQVSKQVNNPLASWLYS